MILDDDFYTLCLAEKGAREIYSDRNQTIPRLKKLGKQHGLRLQVFYLPPPFNRYVILARNGSGLRYHFHETDSLDGRVLEATRFIFFVNKNARRFFKEENEKKRIAKIRHWSALQDNNRAIAREQKRLFQRLGRALGVLPGKTNLPY